MGDGAGNFLRDMETSLGDLAATLGLSREHSTALRKWWREQRAAAATKNGRPPGRRPNLSKTLPTT